MRPERLELEGFMAFRRRTVIEFGDAELFALTGPTGAGKSSVIDAIVFALYGSVPRHGKREVAPVVTQGKLQGRVLLEFTVAGESYTVARVVRKDARGRANTDEARLECGSKVVASGAREVDDAVIRLIGLDYDQFTTCVVLPQGDFERFLHAKPAERQGLLIALLDLGIYDLLADLATHRQRHAEGRLAEIEALAQGLAGITKEDRERSERRVRDLEELLKEVESSSSEIDRLRTQGTEMSELIVQLDEQLGRLGGLSMPKGAEAIAEQIEIARAEETATREQAERAEEQAVAAEAAIGPIAPAEYDRILGLLETIDREQGRAEGTRRSAAEAETALTTVISERDKARDALDQLKSKDLASHLRTGLAEGDPCPVCGRRVETVPASKPIEGLDAASTALEEAEQSVKVVERQVTSLQSTAAEIARRITAVRVELETVEWLQADTPAGELAAKRDVAVRSAGHLDEARRVVAECRRKVDAAKKALAGLAQEERTLQMDLQTTRDRVASLGPPAVDPSDVIAGWKALQQWAKDQVPGLRSKRQEADTKRSAFRDRYVELDEELRKRCRGLEVHLRDARIRDAVVDSLSEARGTVERVTRQLEQMDGLSSERKTVDAQAAVARDLARHLRANNFEKWLLDEALRVLASGANRRLEELARGQYSLALSERLDFEVVDHFAADERRPVRSLSGGETFLVSLALALSLADHVAEMAMLGVNRLESIFLDEGFGTLDQETLDTVASVVTEIGAGGKTVGLITHVKELAEQVPVQFRVTRDAEGANVERLEHA